jgi:hypothetical protein
MKRAVKSKSIAAMLVAAAALAGGSFVGADHSAPTLSTGKPLHLCPPAC